MAAAIPDALVDENAIACAPDEAALRLELWRDLCDEVPTPGSGLVSCADQPDRPRCRGGRSVGAVLAPSSVATSGSPPGDAERRLERLQLCSTRGEG
jgi:hypothetical protein